MSEKIEIPVSGGLLLLRLRGYIDAETQKRIRDSVEKAFSETPPGRPTLLLISESTEAVYVGPDGNAVKLGPVDSQPGLGEDGLTEVVNGKREIAGAGRNGSNTVADR